MQIIVLAGGFGTRLWPLSQKHCPKQFLKIDGDLSLLQSTILRGLNVCQPGDIFVATTSSLRQKVLNDISPYHIPTENILIEPDAKNTAPAIALAFKKILLQSTESMDTPFLICPADHWIEDNASQWIQVMDVAANAAKRGKIAAFGIPATSPETGYGYIQASQQRNGDGAEAILSFKEKPDLATAKSYVAAGGYYWNSGMFCLTPRTFFRELGIYNPSLAKFFSKDIHTIEKEFSTLIPISIDYAIMEKSPHSVVISFPLEWSDVGTWAHLYAKLSQDENGNVKRGHVLFNNTRASLAISENKTLVTSDVDDLIIVQSDDMVFVSKKNTSEEELKKIVERVDNEKHEKSSHNSSYRPWGYYTVLSQGQGYLTKKIVVYPGKRTSLQFHHHRDEHWVIAKGTAKIVNGDEVNEYGENASIFVKKRQPHRIENFGKENLELIEVQYGDDLREDDIVRVDDDYGRVKR